MDYPLLRSSLHPRFQGLPTGDLEHLLVSQLAAYPEDVEDFLSGLNSFGRGALGVAQKALPGIVQGASSGAALGPWGALVGALGGGVASALASPTQTPATGPGVRPPMLSPNTLVPTATSTGGVPGMSLLGMLSRPEVVQALGSLALGRLGRSSVTVGQTPVPVGAIANLLSVLAAKSGASVQAPADEDAESVPVYLRAPSGELLVADPTSAHDRAGVLLGLFESTPVCFAGPVEDVEDWEILPYDEAWDESESLYEGLSA